MTRFVAALYAVSASAESFVELRERASEVTNLAQTLEPYLQTCRYPEASLTRQCEALKERLMFLGTSQLWRYIAPGAATIQGKQLVVRGCLTCNAPATVAEGLSGGGMVLSRQPKAMRKTKEGFTLDGIELVRTTMAQDLDPQKVAPALTTEFVFQARNQPQLNFGRDKQAVVVVDVVGYRVVDRCGGRVLASWPGEGGTVAATEQTDPTCPGYVKPVVKVEENLPLTLTQEQITKALEGAREDVLVCYDKYGVGGYAPAKMTVTGEDGRAASITIAGKFVDTPTAQCIEKVMRQVRFPRFKDRELHLDWQFFLQD